MVFTFFDFSEKPLNSFVRTVDHLGYNLWFTFMQTTVFKKRSVGWDKL
jgi:hypothetical protein